MSGLINGNSGVGGANSLLQRALSRSTKGKSMRRSSLLNSVNNRNNLLAQNKNKATAAQTQKMYYNMKYHAGQVKDYADRLTDTGDKSVFAKARESGDTSEVVSVIKGFVSQYNSMLENLKESGTRTDTTYLTQLNSISNLKSAELASCGVKRNADGTLAIDGEKLSSADLETLEKVWSGKGGFVGRTALWADSVKASAERSMDAQMSNSYSNLFNNYGSSGNYFNYFR